MTEVTEKQIIDLMKKRGLDDWDIEVALGALRKGVSLDFGGKSKFVLIPERKLLEKS